MGSQSKSKTQTATSNKSLQQESRNLNKVGKKQKLKIMNQQEIVKKFIDSKAINFAALGKFVAENGEAIATSSEPNFYLRFNKRVFDWCIPPYLELNSIEEIGALVKIGQELQVP